MTTQDLVHRLEPLPWQQPDGEHETYAVIEIHVDFDRSWYHTIMEEGYDYQFCKEMASNYRGTHHVVIATITALNRVAYGYAKWSEQ